MCRWHCHCWKSSTMVKSKPKVRCLLCKEEKRLRLIKCLVIRLTLNFTKSRLVQTFIFINIIHKFDWLVSIIIRKSSHKTIWNRISSCLFIHICLILTLCCCVFSQHSSLLGLISLHLSEAFWNFFSCIWLGSASTTHTVINDTLLFPFCSETPSLYS